MLGRTAVAESTESLPVVSHDLERSARYRRGLVAAILALAVVTGLVGEAPGA